MAAGDISIDRRNCHTCGFFYAPDQRVLQGLGNTVLKGTASTALPGCYRALVDQDVQAWIRSSKVGANMAMGSWPKVHPCPETATGCPGWTLDATRTNRLVSGLTALYDAIQSTFPHGSIPSKIDAAAKTIREELWPSTKASTVVDLEGRKPKKKPKGEV